eukprot:6172367-Pleurochrysis_carterae.AAC.2
MARRPATGAGTNRCSSSSGRSPLSRACRSARIFEARSIFSFRWDAQSFAACAFRAPTAAIVAIAPRSLLLPVMTRIKACPVVKQEQVAACGCRCGPRGLTSPQICHLLTVQDSIVFLYASTTGNAATQPCFLDKGPRHVRSLTSPLAICEDNRAGPQPQATSCWAQRVLAASGRAGAVGLACAVSCAVLCSSASVGRETSCEEMKMIINL